MQAPSSLDSKPVKGRRRAHSLGGEDCEDMC